jgi:anthranilate synthase component 2
MSRELLFIENGDSFSWNLLDALPFAREDVALVSGTDRAEVQRLLSTVKAVVIGPGPKDPLRAGLIGWVEAAIARNLPLLGICLGHQAVGVAFGARLERVRPCHGERSDVLFEGSRRFREDGVETVMRYHSLALVEAPPPLRVTARTVDGVVMAVEHASLPVAGLQFHPDSYGTPNGRALLAAFFRSV